MTTLLNSMKRVYLLRRLTSKVYQQQQQVRFIGQKYEKAEEVFQKEVSEQKIQMDDKDYIQNIAKEGSESLDSSGKVKIDSTMKARIQQDDRIQKHLRDHGETNTYSKTL